VVDVDPASRRCYPPVDLNHPYILTEDGLAPSAANPQFHQQVVYAVAMRTIARFELEPYVKRRAASISAGGAA